MNYGNSNVGFAGLPSEGHTSVETWYAAQEIAFGMPVFGYVGDGTRKAYGFSTDTSKTVFSADFIDGNTIDGTINGVTLDTVTYATSSANTVTLLVAELKAKCPGLETAWYSTDKTLYLRLRGGAVTLALTIAGGQSAATATTTTGNSQVFIGIARHQHCAAGKYKAKDAVAVVTQGRVWAPAASASALEGAEATATGFATSGGVDVGATFRSGTKAGLVSGTYLADVEVTGRKALTNADKF